MSIASNTVTGSCNRTLQFEPETTVGVVPPDPNFTQFTPAMEANYSAQHNLAEPEDSWNIVLNQDPPVRNNQQQEQLLNPIQQLELAMMQSRMNSVLERDFQETQRQLELAQQQNGGPMPEWRQPVAEIENEYHHPTNMDINERVRPPTHSVESWIDTTYDPMTMMGRLIEALGHNINSDAIEKLPDIKDNPATKLKQYHGLSKNKFFTDEKIRKFIESDEGRNIINILQHTKIEELTKQTNAAKLVEEWLDKKQWESLINAGYVIIPSKKYKKQGRYYVVFEDANQRVKVFEKKDRGIQTVVAVGGKPYKKRMFEHEKIMELCSIVDASDQYSGAQFVNWDKLLTKIMVLSTDEEELIKNSNKY